MHFSTLAISLGLNVLSWAAPISSVDPAIQSRDLRGRNLRILPLGDSITHGFGSSDQNGWRDDLLSSLKAIGATTAFVGTQRSGSMVDNLSEGYPGATIDQISGHLTTTHTRFTGSSAPNVILLHAGTNDANGNIDVANASKRVSKLIDQVRGYWPGAAVVVAQMVGSTSARTQSAIDVVNAGIKADVSKRVSAGQHVQIADMSRILTSGTFFDYLHPNDAGYKLMSNVWLEALKKTEAAGWI